MSTGTELSTLLTTYLHNDVSLTAASKLIYLNLGLKKIVNDAPLTFRKKEGTLTLNTSDREYSLATDFYIMLGVWHQANGRKIAPTLAAEWIEGIERQVTILSGPPEEYTIVGYDESQDTPAWRIRFDKTPDDEYSIKYWYTPVPTAITADATPAISSMGFDEMLLWASAAIALQPKDPQGHQIAFANYQNCLRQWFEYRSMSADYTPMLRPASQDFKSSFPLPPNFPG